MKKMFEKLGITDRTSFFAVAWQFIKFGLVGASNTIVGYAVYYGLIYFTEIRYIIAYIIAYITGICNSYLWNSRFVFKKNKEKGEEGSNTGTKTFAKSFVSYSIMGIISVGLMYVMVEILRLSEWIAPIINTCITVPLNFLLHKFWAFAAPKK